MMFRRLGAVLRIARALSCSLALHALGWAALREGPTVNAHATSTPVNLIVAWMEPEPLRRPPEPVVLDDPGWTPLLPNAVPEAEPPPIMPPVLEPVLAEPPAHSDEEPTPLSPYWERLRRDLARALHWPAGWRTRTNVEVRVLAVRDGLLPLAPAPVADDPIREAVRRAIEHVARGAARPPEDLVGRDMRLVVRFESHP